ncbi:hypothetical protein [Flavobacterium sp. HTF]|uniref:hypothetical protein n=1 Tax=Flavobacterium sp. HTF TaxID=2170732 RepID=UPI001FAE83D0|nr:hypothetical protein [Flavobacterium sp. HTF]
MKKNLFLLLMLTTQLNFAQNTFPDTGNTGVGTLSPLAKFEVRNGDILVKNLSNTNNNSAIMIGQSIVDGNHTTFGTSIRTVVQSSGNNVYGMQFFTQESYQTGQTEKVRILGNGNVGIGTISPASKLDVNGNGSFNGGIISSVSGALGGYIKLKNPSKTANGVASDWTIFNTTGNYGNSLQFFAYDDVGCATGGLCSNRFTIMDNGNVGIGSTNPINKLDVNGTIHAKEVKVDMTGWSDFVFKKEYTLPALAEVEKHITEKGHLENIPNEEEVLKNGINVGEMNAKLLQKIEELTLYAIEQKKNTDQLTKVILEQNKRIEELEKNRK